VKRALHLASLWSPVVAYGALVFYLSSLSGVADLSLGPDYLSHTAEYVGLTLLIIRALNEDLLRPIPPGVHLSALGLSVLYAISDEIHQIWIPRRTASLKDVLSDALGGVLAIGLAEVIQRVRLRPELTPVAVVLYTRRGCSLCHEARSLLRGLAAEIPLDISEIDVDSDPELARRFGPELPVILAGGVKVSKLTPRREALARRLTRMSTSRFARVARPPRFG